MTAELPSEIIFHHILPRLPAKYVIRLKFVSKQWHAFLTTPMFEKLHADHYHSPKFLLATLTVSGLGTKMYTIDCEEPEDGLTACPPLPFITNSNKIDFLTSFHGLVCVGVKEPKRYYYHEDVKYYDDLILWNPFTREYKTLLKGNYPHECYKVSAKAFSLYYSSSDDDYKLLRIAPDIYIYSLKLDTWRKIDSSEYIKSEPSSWWPEIWWTSIWLNEKLYFLREVKYQSSMLPFYTLLRFDTKTEKFTKIRTMTARRSLKDKDMWVHVFSFSVVRGCIQLCVGYYNFECGSLKQMEVRRMGGGRDGEWTKMVTYSKITCLPWFDNRVNYCDMLSSVHWFEKGPMHVMRNGNWLIHDKYSFDRVDLEKNEKKHIIYSYASGSKVIMKGKYIETFVSPNRYRKESRT